MTSLTPEEREEFAKIWRGHDSYDSSLSFIATLLSKREQAWRERVEKVEKKIPTLEKQLKKYTELPFYREAGEIRGELSMAKDILSLLSENITDKK